MVNWKISALNVIPQMSRAFPQNSIIELIGTDEENIQQGSNR